MTNTQQNEQPTQKNKTELKRYVIIGKRWFDKKNGNTYHAINIVDAIKNTTLFKSKNIVYGYGEQWKHTGYDELLKLKLVQEKNRFNHKLNREMFIYICSDVNTKKELTN